MLRIADLLNNGEDDSQVLDANTVASLKLGRSAFAPERRTKVNEDQDAAMIMTALAEEDEYAASSSETDKPFNHTRGSLSRMQEEMVTTKSTRSFSFPSSQQQLMTNRNIMDSGKPTEASSVSSETSVVGGNKRSTRSLVPELSELNRRAKQRLIVKRCYYNKIYTIESLRNEASTLKHQFRLALEAMQRKEETDKAAGRERDVKLREMFIDTLITKETLREMFIDTLITKETLREEHIRLRRLTDEYYMKNQGRLRQLLDSNHEGLILFTVAVNND